VITIPVKRLHGFLETIRGLMFSAAVEPIYFETRFGIHTFFVTQPIDVVILREDNVVFMTKHNLQPWRVFFWNPRYYRVLELPNGFVSTHHIVTGSKILLQENLRKL
jgi:uncharacterized membrane protein (UPF0127 family)